MATHLNCTIMILFFDFFKKILDKTSYFDRINLDL